MYEATNGSACSAAQAKQQMESKFKKQGVVAGLTSGLTFGLYGVIVGFAANIDPFLGASAILVPIISSGINDSFAAIWLLIFNLIKGRGKEITRSLKTKPGIMICIAALFGGPIANAAYLVGIANAGAAAIPISALCPMFGAILARILFKQKIEKRVGGGMLLCIIGAAVISYAPAGSTSGNFTFGLICAFVAALGWGVEGALSAFGGAVLDPNIAINIRQIVSGLSFIVVLIPALGGLGLFAAAVQVPSILLIIGGAGLLTAISFLSWYKANSTCGCATGMALNITYVFWGIFFSVLLLGQQLTVPMVVGSVVLLLGALFVSVNPMDLIKKKEA
ncbi:MAG: DMT family transporter [Cellulosilyticaceae bacterium]